MRRLTVIFLFLTCLSAYAAGQDGVPFFEYGIEWGSTSTLYASRHQNYNTEEGYRINESHSGWTFISNAYMLVNVGFNVTDWLNVSINTGYAGISEGRRGYPLTARATFYPKGIATDGILCFLDGGVGFMSLKEPSKTCTLLSAGTGYHFSLSRLIGLDLIFKIRMATDHPDIIDIDTGERVPSGRIRENYANSWSINFGVALDF